MLYDDVHVRTTSVYPKEKKLNLVMFKNGTLLEIFSKGFFNVLNQ